MCDACDKDHDRVYIFDIFYRVCFFYVTYVLVFLVFVIFLYMYRLKFCTHIVTVFFYWWWCCFYFISTQKFKCISLIYLLTIENQIGFLYYLIEQQIIASHKWRLFFTSRVDVNCVVLNCFLKDGWHQPLKILSKVRMFMHLKCLKYKYISN